MPPDLRIQKAWKQKITINQVSVTKALDDLAKIINDFEHLAPQFIPIYERLERELEMLNSKGSTINKIRARALAAKQSKHQMAA